MAAAKPSSTPLRARTLSLKTIRLFREPTNRKTRPARPQLLRPASQFFATWAFRLSRRVITLAMMGRTTWSGFTDWSDFGDVAASPMLDLQPDDFLELTYPTTTHVRTVHGAARERRCVTIRRIRDLVVEPLSITEFARRPFVTRSRWLVAGYDHDRNAWRQFYLGTATEFAAPGQLRVALYEPGDPKPQRLLTRGFAPTVKDRKTMLRLLARWSNQDFGELELRVTCPDMSLIT